MNFIYVPALAIVIGLVQAWFAQSPIAETVLMNLLLIQVGISGFISFFLHGFRGNKLAEDIGWPKGNPFQWEVACTGLAFGILGIISYWIKGDFWLATIVGFSAFLWGAAYGHIREIRVNKNYAPGNAGIVLYYDIIFPAILIGLYIAYLYDY